MIVSSSGAFRSLRLFSLRIATGISGSKLILDDGDVMVWSFAPSSSAMAGLNSPMPLTNI
jgi:hypothetical protein